jgi:hypothetical protein
LNSVVSVTSLASSTAIQMPALACPTDPVFAAIATYKRTLADYDRATREQWDAEEKFEKEFGSDKPDAFSREVRGGLAEIEPGFKRCQTDTHEKIDAGATQFPPEIISAFHQELDRQTAIYEERVGPFADANIRAGEIWHEAREALTQTVPTSLAGLAAALKHLSTDGEMSAYNDHADMIDALAAAAANLMRAA